MSQTWNPPVEPTTTSGPPLVARSDGRTKAPWPDPTPEMLSDPKFEAVWQLIKSWDINVPEVYWGYCHATGNHVRAILDALSHIKGANNG